jgi:hypothetical protein
VEFVRPATRVKIDRELSGSASNLFDLPSVRQVLSEMVPPGRNSPEDPEEATRRLSSDQSVWDQAPEREPAPAEHPAPVPRPLWRRELRVNLLIAVAVVGLLLVGFLVGASVAGTDRPAPAAQPPPVPSVDRSSPTVTSIVVRPGPPPRACTTAIEWADKAIAYMVGNVRDDRLTKAVQGFVASRRACQRAAR